MWSPFAVAARLLLARPAGAWPRFAWRFIVVPRRWLIPEWVTVLPGARRAVGPVRRIPVAAPGSAGAGRRRRSVAGQRGPGHRQRGDHRGAAPPSRRARARRAGAGAPAPAPAAGAGAAGAAALVVVAGAGPLAFALTPPFPAARSVTVALVQPGIIADDALRVHASRPDGVPAIPARSGNGTLGGVRPDLIVWGESSVADDLTLPSSAPLLRQIEALSARRRGRDPGQPGRHGAWQGAREVGRARQPVRDQGHLRQDAPGAVRGVHPVPRSNSAGSPRSARPPGRTWSPEPARRCWR